MCITHTCHSILAHAHIQGLILGGGTLVPPEKLPNIILIPIAGQRGSSETS